MTALMSVELYKGCKRAMGDAALTSGEVTVRPYTPADDADLDALQHNSSMEHRFGRCPRRPGGRVGSLRVTAARRCPLQAAVPWWSCYRGSKVTAPGVPAGSACRWLNTYLRVATQEKGGYNARALDFDDHVILVAQTAAQVRRATLCA